MTPVDVRRSFFGDEGFDLALQGVGAATDPLDVPGDQVGVLEGRAVDLLLHALGGAEGEAKQLAEVIDGAERAAAGFGVHARKTSGSAAGDPSCFCCGGVSRPRTPPPAGAPGPARLPGATPPSLPPRARWPFVDPIP